MRTNLLGLALMAIFFASTCQADHPQVVGTSVFGCGHAQVSVPSYPSYPTYAGCTSCGTGGCGSGLCSNWPAFYAQLYADFYARNPWYLQAKQEEKAARWARLHGKDAPPPQPLNIPRPY